MGERKNFDQPTRVAVWEAHSRKCAFTGDPVDYSELQVDHVIPVEGEAARIAELRAKGIIPSDFDLNGFCNLLPTRGFRNRQKTNHIANDASVAFFLGLAEKTRPKVERLYHDAVARDSALNGYLQMSAAAQRNGVSVEEMLEATRHQAEGEIVLRIAPEVEGSEIYSANAAVAASLMTMPFSLGGGSIDQVVLQNDADECVICQTAEEYLVAKANGYYGLSQADINIEGLANRTSELLRAISTAKFAPSSEIRYPRVTMRDLDHWSSGWLTLMMAGEQALTDAQAFEAAYPTLAAAVSAGVARVRTQDAWSLDLDWDEGYSVRLAELLRADLDGDEHEEILVSCVGYAEQGTLRLPLVAHGKVDAAGIIQVGQIL